MGSRLQQQRPRRVPAHRPPLCPAIEAALGGVIGDAQQARPPDDERAPPPRWTLRRLIHEPRFGRRFCRDRAALHRLKLSWKKKLLGRADPAQRQAFLDDLEPVLDGAARDRHLLVYLDEIHQDAGYGWSARGERAWVCSTSPGLSAKRTFYGLYLYNDGQVRHPRPMASTRSRSCSDCAPKRPTAS